MNCDSNKKYPLGISTTMDESNQKALQILKNEGRTAFINHVFNPTGNKELSYAEMRQRYG